MQVKSNFEEHIKGSFSICLANPKPLMKELSLKVLSAIQKRTSKVYKARIMHP